MRGLSAVLSSVLTVIRLYRELALVAVLACVTGAGVVMSFVDTSFTWPLRLMGGFLCACLTAPLIGYIAYTIWYGNPGPRLHRTPGASWAPWFSPASSGEDTRGPGVAIPLQPVRRNPAVVAIMMAGVGTIGCAVFVGVTGSGLDHPHGAERWIAVGIFGGLGILAVGGAVLTLIMPVRGRIAHLVLTPDAVWLDNGWRKVAWDDIGSVSLRTVSRRSLADPVLRLDLLSRTGLVACGSLDVSTVANPSTLGDVLRAAVRVPALRARFAYPDAPALLTTLRPTR